VEGVAVGGGAGRLVVGALDLVPEVEAGLLPLLKGAVDPLAAVLGVVEAVEVEGVVAVAPEVAALGAVAGGGGRAVRLLALGECGEGDLELLLRGARGDRRRRRGEGEGVRVSLCE
jgi:hypothetical protein